MKHFILIILALLLLTLGGCKKDDYAAATAEMDKGNWETAISLFTELGSYKDSEALIKECQRNIDYAAAKELMDSGDYAGAESAFTALGGFSDASELAELCHKQPVYDAALVDLDEGRYAEAQAAFQELNGFLDSAERLDYCAMQLKYAAAKELMFAQELDAAAEALDALGDFEDAAALAADCRYRALIHRAEELSLQPGDAANAESLQSLADGFKALGDCRDAAELADIYALLAEGGYAAAAETAKALSYNSGDSMLPEFWRTFFSDAASGAPDGITDEYLTFNYCEGLFVSGNPRDLNVNGWSLSSLDLSKCAGQGTGKLLVVYHDGAVGSDDYKVCVDLMQTLPDKYFPQSLEEVEYIIYIDRGHTQTGTYNLGTKAARLWIKVSVKRYPGGTTVKDAGTAYGGYAPSSFTASYIPTWKTGSEPDITDNYLSALDYFGIVGRDKDYAYYLNDGGAVVIGRANKTEVEVLPAELGGYPVVGIERELFYDDDKLREVTLPATLRYIAPRAFSYCGALEKVVLPEGLKILPEEAFSLCSVLKSIELPESLIFIDSYAFTYSGISEIVLPSGLKQLGNQALNSTAIGSVTLNDGLWRLGSPVSSSDDNLQFYDGYARWELALPASLTEIYGEIPDNVRFMVNPGTYGEWFANTNGIVIYDPDAPAIEGGEALPESLDAVTEALADFGYDFDYDEEAKLITVYPIEFYEYDLESVLMLLVEEEYDMVEGEATLLSLLGDSYDALCTQLKELAPEFTFRIDARCASGETVYSCVDGVKESSFLD